VGAIVEVAESAAPTCPTMVYAASSVADLAAARQFYGDVVGCTLEPLDRPAADESLWGLACADRDGFIVPIGDIHLEVVAYKSPVAGRVRIAAFQTRAS